MERFNKKIFKNGVKANVGFFQDNQSFSTKGVLRGLHYQTGDLSQAKLVGVLQGEVLDVAVNNRPESETYGQYEAVFIVCTELQTIFYSKRFCSRIFSIIRNSDFFLQMR